MKRFPVLLVSVVALVACGGAEADTDAAATDSVTQAQRDSAIGASRLPGAAGVRGALDASDAAAARAAALDSAAGGR